MYCKKCNISIKVYSISLVLSLIRDKINNRYIPYPIITINELSNITQGYYFVLQEHYCKLIKS